MGVRIRHPEIDGEAEIATVAQFHAVYEGRGWELVPEGTPHPDEVAALAARAPVPASAELDMVPDGEAPADDESDASDDAAAKPPRKRRQSAASTDAATDDAATED